MTKTLKHCDQTMAPVTQGADFRSVRCYVCGYVRKTTSQEKLAFLLGYLAGVETHLK